MPLVPTRRRDTMSPPTGAVTFLFTDIEGSTRLWEDYPEAMRSALARHDAILREAIESHNGHVFKTIGDAFCAVFPAPSDALQAALSTHWATQQQLMQATLLWSAATALRESIG